MNAATILHALLDLFLLAWAVAATTVLYVERAAWHELDDATRVNIDVPDGVIRVPNRLTPQQADEIRDRWLARYGPNVRVIPRDGMPTAAQVRKAAEALDGGETA